MPGGEIRTHREDGKGPGECRGGLQLSELARTAQTE